MKTILIHMPSLSGSGVFNAEARDSYFQPFIYLREKLRLIGYKLEMSDGHSLENCAWVWFFDAESIVTKKGFAKCKGVVKSIVKKQRNRNLYRECLEEGMDKKMVLFLWEPPSVSPGNWDQELHKLFPRIFTWNDNYVDGCKIIKMNIPQPSQFPSMPKIAFENQKLLVNISTNRFSRHPRELYSARRASIRHFEQTHPENFDLYGIGWNSPVNILETILPLKRRIYPSYQGTVQNKWDVLPKYRFSICYENIHGEPGYVTEKIFDSMRANCVPIYWGAPNIADYVDTGAFVDRREFRTNFELESYLVNMNEKEYTHYLDNIQYYLNGNRFKKFLPENFADTIIRALEL